MSGSRTSSPVDVTPPQAPEDPADKGATVGDPALGIDEDTRLGPNCRAAFYVRIDTDGNRTVIDNRCDVTVHDIAREKLRNAGIIRRHMEGNGWAAIMRRKRERRRTEGDGEPSPDASGNPAAPTCNPNDEEQI